MSKTSADTKTLRQQYYNFMHEIKLRREIIYRAAHALYELPPLASYELCFLQLRYICELIGLGCLAAHGDISATRRQHHLHKPGQIISELEKLHPDFFPAPGEPIRNDADQLIGLRPVKNGALTKEEVKSLYDAAGTVLHRGSLKNLRPHKVDFERVNRWDAKIVNLLNFHHIKLIQPNFQIWARMSAKEHDGGVAVQLVRTTWTGDLLGALVDKLSRPAP